MNLAEQFHAWALEPSRTNDELYTIELLVESAWGTWCHRHKRHEPLDVDAKTAQAKRRMLNPAYRARISREKLDALVEVWADMRRFSVSTYNDRPMGEVETLRFFPQLTDVGVSGNFPRIDALAGLRGLKSLSINSETLADIGALSGLPALETLHLTLRTPWPELSALATLPALRELRYHGNLLALRDVPPLLAVVEARFDADASWQTPLRDLRELPPMPAVRHLRVESVAALAGVERFPILNLQLKGPFTDLSPLAAQTSVTWLRIQGQGFMDLRPLARMSALRELRLERELPLDLSPLADAPRLRQVWVHGCDIIATELASINALLPPWSDDFMLPEPRPLAPVHFIAVDRNREDTKLIAPEPPDPRPSFYGDDLAYAAAENRWFKAELRRRLDVLLGRGWRGRDDQSTSWSWHDRPGNVHVHLNRFEDTFRLREVVQALRELMAAARFPWSMLLIIEPHGNLDDEMDEIAARDDDDEDEATAAERDRQERLEYKQYARERRAFLERQHRLRLQQEQGLPIDPDDFSPPPEPEETDESDEGGSAVLDGDDDEGADSLGSRFHLYAHLEEEVLSVWLDDTQLAADYYGETPENWHELPEPPGQRPRPW